MTYSQRHQSQVAPFDRFINLSGLDIYFWNSNRLSNSTKYINKSAKDRFAFDRPEGEPYVLPLIVRF